MADNHMKGTVRWFSARRGYGFLSDENGVDYFVHYSEITGEGFRQLGPDDATLQSLLHRLKRRTERGTAE